MMSPGWQFKVSQMASRVENLTPWTFPVLIFDRLTYDIPTFSASSFKLIFLSAMMRSKRRIIAILSQEVIGFRLQGGAVFEYEIEDIADDSADQHVQRDVEQVQLRLECKHEKDLDQDYGEE